MNNTSGDLAGETIVKLLQYNRYVLALTQSGKVLSWGAGFHGSRSGSTSWLVPTRINMTGLAGVIFTDIALARSRSAALYSLGRIIQWGSLSPRPVISFPTLLDVFNTDLEYLLVSKIFGGDPSMMAITASGEVFGWGINAGNRFLVAENATYFDQPVRVNATAFVGRNISSIYLGPYAVHALTSEGELISWGSQIFRAVGNETLLSATPVNQSQGLGGKNPIKISAGGLHSLVLTLDGSVFIFGDYYSRIPMPEMELEGKGIENIWACAQRNFALANRTLWGVCQLLVRVSYRSADIDLCSWGTDNSFGEIADTLDDLSSPTNLNITDFIGSDRKILDLTCSDYHTMIFTFNPLDMTYDVFGWGSNGYGQLGNNLIEISANTPPGLCNRPNDILATQPIRRISASARASFVLYADNGGLYGTGDCGDELLLNQGACAENGYLLSLNRVSDPSLDIGIVDISAGQGHLVALTSDGKVWTWGKSLGFGTRDLKLKVRISPQGPYFLLKVKSEVVRPHRPGQSHFKLI
jgi:alpha-tubulin suppressor-like RCC1 family protein